MLLRKPPVTAGQSSVALGFFIFKRVESADYLIYWGFTVIIFF